MSFKVQLGDSLVCQAWNADATKVAIVDSQNSDVVTVYAVDKTTSPWTFNAECTLEEHETLVGSVDFSIDGKILTTSHDRGVLVWVPQEEGYRPQLVYCDLKRAATVGRWDSSGDLICFGSGDKTVNIASLDTEGTMAWTPERIRRHQSAVLSLAFHSDGRLSSGGSDSCVYTGAPGSREVEQIEVGGWVNSLAVGPTDELAIACQDATVTIGGDQIYVSCAPFRSIAWLSPDMVVAGGWDMNPHLFVKATDGWRHSGPISCGSSSGPKKRALAAGFAVFGGRDKFGRGGAAASLKTFHTRAIVDVRKISESHFAAIAEDGFISLWPIPSLEDALAKLSM